MPPAVGTSTNEWCAPAPLITEFQTLEESLLLHSMQTQTQMHQADLTMKYSMSVLPLANASTFSAPPEEHMNMPFDDLTVGSYYSALPPLHNATYSNLQDKAVFDENSYLSSSRYVLDVAEDMSAPMWSSASTKTVQFDIPAWLNKPAHAWSEADVLEWFVYQGASRDKVQHKTFQMTGEDLINLSMQPDCLASLERELGINVLAPLRDIHTQEQAACAPDATAESCFESIYNPSRPVTEDITPLQNWTTAPEDHQTYHINDTRPKQELCSSDTDSESEPSIKESIRVRTGRRGRPPSANSKAAKKKLEKRHGRLWEFIRDLLKDPNYCPSLICWENHDEGVFRFVSSEKVAQLWGSKRGNTKMTYEKLSRAMRYYYKSDILQAMPHRRLVYRFGPNATNWRHPNPNFRNKRPE